jgi:uncharacterized flavoprotein (TIGR03862 family)
VAPGDRSGYQRARWNEDRMTQPNRPSVAIIGAGPAGLMAAETAARGGAAVTIFDRMPSPGRKLLLAGRGGLNLTHTEPQPGFLARYGAAADDLRGAIARFGPDALRHWCTDLGLETFVGSSGRVFPASFKTSPLLRAWLRRLAANGVTFRLRHRWTGWDGEDRLVFDTPGGPIDVEADATILALGGATWPQLGSDGSWADSLGKALIDVAPLEPANCGFTTPWSPQFRDRFEGEPLHNIAVRLGDARVRGEALVTRAGLEGGAIYAIAAAAREAIVRDGAATIAIALRPDLSHDALLAKLAKRQPKQSFSNALRKALGLAPVAIGLLREVAQANDLTLTDLDDDALARLVNAVPIRLEAPMPIARAISTAGGVRFSNLNDAFMIRRRPGLFVAGEMMDWEAPTGGYLLQACFATGVAAGRGAVDWLAARGLLDAPATVEVGAAADGMV